MLLERTVALVMGEAGEEISERQQNNVILYVLLCQSQHKQWNDWPPDLKPILQSHYR